MFSFFPFGWGWGVLLFVFVARVCYYGTSQKVWLKGATMELQLGDKVKVAGKGNTTYLVVDKDSPVRLGDWIVRRANGSMLSTNPNKLRKVG